MQKKYKRALIVFSVLSVVLTLALVLAGLGRIQLDEYALNYNMASAVYAENKVYGPGLYWIGISNQFIRIKKNQQALSFQNITTFSSDFYSVTANIEANLFFNLDSSDIFQTTSKFYQLLGQNPLDFIRPIFKNQILIILSSKNSEYYQTTASANIDLQSQITQRLQNILSLVINSTVNIIVQSIICQGTTNNTQIIDREIQALIHDIERTQSEKIELTDYMSNVMVNKRAEVYAVSKAVQMEAICLQRILNKYGPNITGINISRIIYDNMPLKYNINLVNILEELAVIGNRTFPY